MPKRFYTENEVASLIRRAVEMEAERSVSREKSSRKGLSISELEQIAAESGIDPELIRRAANELENIGSDGATAKSDKVKASIKKDEIVCERWADINPDNSILDELVVELNHRYGTSDQDANWWDQFWDNYNGKAKVRKTSTSLEWHYTDEFGYYSTRVLFQIRGGKFRIRVSKRQLWGMEWNTGINDYIYPAVFFPVFMVLGGVLSLSLLDTWWPGIAGGAVLSGLLYPIIKHFRTRSLMKHQEQVTDTANNLVDLAMQLSAEPREFEDHRVDRSVKTAGNKIAIEITDENENRENTESRLRNNLREK